MIAHFVTAPFVLHLFPFKAVLQKGEAFDECFSRAGGIEAEETV